MKQYQIKTTKYFLKKFNKLPNTIQRRFKNQIKKLKHNPLKGKSIRYKWFRELKEDKYRVYFVISEQKVIILFIDISDKKTQEKIIESIMNDIKSKMKNL